MKIEKVVKFHGIIVNTSQGQPSASKSTVEQIIFKSNEQFAQIGIRAIANVEEQSVGPYDGVDLSNGFDMHSNENLATGLFQLTNENKALFDHNDRTASENDVELYVVNGFTSGLGTINPNGRGQAYYSSGLSDQKYADIVVISALYHTPFTLTHEASHLLLNSTFHITEEWFSYNLMYIATAMNDSVTSATKRYNEEQTVNIMGNVLLPPFRPNLLNDPE